MKDDTKTFLKEGVTMYSATNVISMRKFRWNKRFNSMKNIALNPVLLATIVMVLCSVLNHNLLSSQGTEYLDLYLKYFFY